MSRIRLYDAQTRIAAYMAMLRAGKAQSGIVTGGLVLAVTQSINRGDQNLPADGTITTVASLAVAVPASRRVLLTGVAIVANGAGAQLITPTVGSAGTSPPTEILLGNVGISFPSSGVLILPLSVVAGPYTGNQTRTFAFNLNVPAGGSGIQSTCKSVSLIAELLAS